mmetsp:Transcript_15087/g.21527  ORF Transcript_15087/g.21527 Transcript_15087/m.21527 type:complete len:81 (+) Transcript_15087:502-744(+)
MRQVFTTPDNFTTSLRIGKYECRANETNIARGYASFASGTGNPLMNIGTIIPPPVQARINDTSLYEVDVVGLIVEKTLLP